VIDESHVFDPSLSIVEVTCPECGHDRAIYTMAPDENETKLVARMMCASVTGTVAKCSFIWELDDDDLLMEDSVTKGKKAQ
jgi:ribosomal protein S27E